MSKQLFANDPLTTICIEEPFIQDSLEILKYSFSGTTLAGLNPINCVTRHEGDVYITNNEETRLHFLVILKRTLQNY